MTDKDGFELSRRKALASIGGIGVASAGAGLGTSAYFSDEESFESNTITAGELQLSATWQQLYYGAPQSRRPEDYGDAERPFVNAYPDHDGNGLQSFEDSEEDVHEYVDISSYDNPEEAAKAGSNLEFSCDEIDTFDDPSFDPNDDALIELEDVKPGDCGEITFGIKLCDNPGYIWFSGELVEESHGDHEDSDEAYLADEIVAKAWYDLDGDNVYDEGEPKIASGTLSEVLDKLSDGQLLAFDPEHGTEKRGSSSSKVSGGIDETINEIDEIIVTADDDRFADSRARNYTCDDYEESLERFEDGDLGGAELFGSDFEEGDTAEGCATITVDARTDNTVTLSSDEPVVIVSVKGGNQGEQVYVFADPVILDEATFATPTEQEISNIDVCCLDNGDGPPVENGDECFQPLETRFIGFEWCLPSTVGNEVQGDDLKFDLGFYTEQCRHNDEPGDPFA